MKRFLTILVSSLMLLGVAAPDAEAGHRKKRNKHRSHHSCYQSSHQRSHHRSHHRSYRPYRVAHHCGSCGDNYYGSHNCGSSRYGSMRLGNGGIYLNFGEHPYGW